MNFSDELDQMTKEQKEKLNKELHDSTKYINKYFANEMRLFYRLLNNLKCRFYPNMTDVLYREWCDNAVEYVYLKIVPTYDPQKGSFDDFLSNSMERKFHTFMRYASRECRSSYKLEYDKDGKVVHKPIASPSMDANIQSKDGMVAFGTMIADEKTNVEEEVFGKYEDDDELKNCKQYLEGLSKKQEKVARLIATGYDMERVRELAGLTVSEFNQVMIDLRAPRNRKNLKF